MTIDSVPKKGRTWLCPSRHRSSLLSDLSADLPPAVDPFPDVVLPDDVHASAWPTIRGRDERLWLLPFVHGLRA